MKLIQTQYPLAKLSTNNSAAGLIALVIILSLSAAAGIYLNRQTIQKHR